MLLLNSAEVEELLDLDGLLDALAVAMADLSNGTASVPRRTAADVSEHEAFLATMPAFVPSLNVLETKLVSVFPHNRDRPTHQAIIVCFDPSNGAPVALMDGTYVTAARTAAGSALATKLLARRDARVLTVVGTGVQARSHARAVTRVHPIERVRITGRSAEKVKALADQLAKELETPVEAADDVAAAVRGADIVCLTTHSPTPVISREWLSPGAHVNSVGYNPAGREVDEQTVVDALVVVESRNSTLAAPPSGSNDLLWPIRDGLITEQHVHAEIGELVEGRASGRTSEGQITLYKSAGVAVQDAAAAGLVLEAARKAGAGTHIEI